MHLYAKAHSVAAILAATRLAVLNAGLASSISLIKHATHSTALIACVLFGFCVNFPPALANPSSMPPNILIFLADDLGWNDVGYHGSIIETPNIDRLAAEGIELDRFYVQPSCSPTRAGLMTGKSPIRLGMSRPLAKNEVFGLPLEEKILPQYFADIGYQRHMVGKWHLGKHTRQQLPNARGFEHFYGSLTGGIGYWNKVHGGGYDWQRNGKTVREEGYITHLTVQEVTTLLDSRDINRPNLMYVAFQAPHIPNEAPQVTVGKYAHAADSERASHAAMVDEMDQAIGQILAAYRAHNMLDNTIVLFMSDNGGLIKPSKDPTKQTGLEKFGVLLAEWFDRPIPGPDGLEFIVSNVIDPGSDNSPLPGGKMYVDEGGVRVPALVWWPNTLTPRVHTQPVTISDVLPTLLEAVGKSENIPSDLDGRSQWRALLGEPADIADFVVTGFFDRAIFRWPWKLHPAVDDKPARLYNVAADPSELENRVDQHPDIVAVLSKRLEDWPVGPQQEIPVWDLIFDPDTFGGEEDRVPWAEAVLDH